MSYQNYLIHVIGDYCDHNAFNRVKQKLRFELARAHVPFQNISFDETWVPPFDTHATGFNLAELARNSQLADETTRHIFYVNTAPRKDDLTGRKDNAGEKMIYLKLKNNVEILAVNSGHSLAYLDDAIEKVTNLDISDAGSQFRSLNVFPEALHRLAAGDDSVFTSYASAELPKRPGPHTINLIDGYGNVKTNMKANEFDQALYGKVAKLSINGVQHRVKISEKLFSDPEGFGLILYRGSSGWEENGEMVHFMEIGLRGASAADRLDNFEADSPVDNGDEFTLDIEN